MIRNFLRALFIIFSMVACVTEDEYINESKGLGFDFMYTMTVIRYKKLGFSLPDKIENIQSNIYRSAEVMIKNQNICGGNYRFLRLESFSMEFRVPIKCIQDNNQVQSTISK